MKKQIQTLELTIPNRRELLMGVGIIMVVLYHYDTGLWFQKFFYPGFLGVDIFLFISGYGLCRSFERNKIHTFFRRRIKRILPMFLLLAIVKCSLYVLGGGYLSLSDWFFSLTSLSYWGTGGVFVDWYLCGLLALYLFFPLLYKLPVWGGAVLCFLACFVSVFFRLEWYHQCLLLRLPIFYLGICCYKHSFVKAFKSSLLIFGVAFVLFVVLWFNRLTHTFTIIYPLAPFVILGISVLLAKSKNSFIILKWIGKHSLEIYVTDCIVMQLISNHWILIPSIMYFVLLGLITPAVCFINKKCMCKI